MGRTFSGDAAAGKAPLAAEEPTCAPASCSSSSAPSGGGIGSTAVARPCPVSSQAVPEAAAAAAVPAATQLERGTLSTPEELMARADGQGGLKLTWFYDEEILESARQVYFEVRQQSEGANGRLRTRLHTCPCRKPSRGEEVSEQSLVIDGCAPGRVYMFSVRACAPHEKQDTELEASPFCDSLGAGLTLNADGSYTTMSLAALPSEGASLSAATPAAVERIAPASALAGASPIGSLARAGPASYTAPAAVEASAGVEVQSPEAVLRRQRDEAEVRRSVAAKVELMKQQMDLEEAAKAHAWEAESFAQAKRELEVKPEQHDSPTRGLVEALRLKGSRPQVEETFLLSQLGEDGRRMAKEVQQRVVLAARRAEEESKVLREDGAAKQSHIAEEVVLADDQENMPAKDVRPPGECSEFLRKWLQDSEPRKEGARQDGTDTAGARGPATYKLSQTMPQLSVEGPIFTRTSEAVQGILRQVHPQMPCDSSGPAIGKATALSAALSASTASAGQKQPREGVTRPCSPQPQLSQSTAPRWLQAEAAGETQTLHYAADAINPSRRGVAGLTVNWSNVSAEAMMEQLETKSRELIVATRGATAQGRDAGCDEKGARTLVLADPKNIH